MWIIIAVTDHSIADHNTSAGLFMLSLSHFSWDIRGTLHVPFFQRTAAMRGELVSPRNLRALTVLSYVVLDKTTCGRLVSELLPVSSLQSHAS